MREHSRLIRIYGIVFVLGFVLSFFSIATAQDLSAGCFQDVCLRKSLSRDILKKISNGGKTKCINTCSKTGDKPKLCASGRYKIWECSNWNHIWKSKQATFFVFDKKLVGLYVNRMLINEDWNRQSYCAALETKYKDQLSVSSDCATGNLFFVNKRRKYNVGVEIFCEKARYRTPEMCFQSVKLYDEKATKILEKSEKELEEAAKKELLKELP